MIKKDIIQQLLFRYCCFSFFFSSRRRHTRLQGDWSSDVCSSDLCPAILKSKNRLFIQQRSIFMIISRAIALSSVLFIFSIGQAHAQAFCSNDGVGNSINDGKNHYVLLPSRTLEVPLPFDIDRKSVV